LIKHGTKIKLLNYKGFDIAKKIKEMNLLYCCNIGCIIFITRILMRQKITICSARKKDDREKNDERKIFEK
jgi:uncharacterized protein YutD